MMNLHIADYVLIVALGVAAFSDIKYRKVWNWLTASAILVGFALAFHTRGGAGLIDSLKGFGVMLGAGLVGYMIGFIGAGDGKLLAGVGSITGIKPVGLILAGSAIAGGVMALVALAMTFGLKSGLRKIGPGFMQMAAAKSVHAGAIDEKKTRLPYSLAIAAGALFWMAIR